MARRYDVFISYARRDRRFVSRLVRGLRQHHLSAFYDVDELRVGDRHERSIARTIGNCKFFCLVVSPASLASEYIGRVELGAAHEVQRRRPAFILPILRPGHHTIPTNLSQFTYLDFSTSRKYMSHLRQLVDRLSGAADRFTGFRIYKGVDTALTGQCVGVGQELQKVPQHGAGVKVFYRSGRADFIEMYRNGHRDGAKAIGYDRRGRVATITLIRDSEIVDTWHYSYDRRGQRQYKDVAKPGSPAHVRFYYDKNGVRTREVKLDQDGKELGPAGQGQRPTSSLRRARRSPRGRGG